MTLAKFGTWKNKISASNVNTDKFALLNTSAIFAVYHAIALNSLVLKSDAPKFFAGFERQCLNPASVHFDSVESSRHKIMSLSMKHFSDFTFCKPYINISQ